MMIHLLHIICLLLIIAVVIACVVLFYPISYEGDVDITNKKGNFFVKWLFRLIRFRFVFDEGISAVLKIAFVTIDFTDPEAKRKRALKKQKKQARKKAKALRKREKERRKWLRKRGRKPDESLLEDNTDMNLESSADTSAGEKEETKTSKLSGIKKMLPKVKKIWNALRDTDLLHVLMPKVMKLINQIAPKRIKGEISFGMEDPSVTGKIVGGICMIPFLYETELRVIPDFECESNYIEGQFTIKGKIRIIHLLLFVVSCIKEKQVRRFIKLLRANSKRKK